MSRIIPTAVLLFTGLLALSVHAASPAPRLPNILFLLADDMRWDAMGCVGDPVIHTPHLDALAKHGVLFTNHFVTTPICCVSRASIFSGQWESRHGIPDFKTPFSPQAWQQTYPMLLKKGGYRIGFIGKFGVGAQVEGPAKTFDYWRGFAGQGNYFTKGNPEHLTAKMGDQAIAFLRESAGHQPFCLSVSFKAPHAQDGAEHEFQPDPRDEHLYDTDTMPIPASATEKEFARMQPFVQKSEARRRWERRFATPRMAQATIKDYDRLISGVDREVGRMMQTLDELHLTDNTLIVFTSDNGMFLGEHGLAGKWFLYEESIRDALIIVDPHLPSSRLGARNDAMTLNVDFAPTLLDYAGMTAPATMQGHSLRPLVQGKSIPWREEAYFEHHTLPGILPPSEGVRNGQWKYLRWLEPNPVTEELYDLKADPREEQNLAADPAHAATLAAMRERWKTLKQQAK